EFRDAAEVRVGGEGKRPVRGERQRAGGRTGLQREGERIPLGVMGRELAGQRRVFRRRQFLDQRGRNGRVVDRPDRDGDGRRRALGPGGVAGAVGEGGRVVEVGAPPVGERAVGVQGQRAVGRPADQHGAQGVAVRVGVGGQHARGGDRQHLV